MRGFRGAGRSGRWGGGRRTGPKGSAGAGVVRTNAKGRGGCAFAQAGRRRTGRVSKTPVNWRPMPDQGSAPSNEFTSPGLRRGAAHDSDRRDTPPETEGGSVAGGPKRGGAERTVAGRAGLVGVGVDLLDGIEWLGYTVPDPALLFLIMALLVLGLSGCFAPRLPEGFRIEWTRDLTDRPDERTPAFLREET